MLEPKPKNVVHLCVGDTLGESFEVFGCFLKLFCIEIDNKINFIFLVI